MPEYRIRTPEIDYDIRDTGPQKPEIENKISVVTYSSVLILTGLGYDADSSRHPHYDGLDGIFRTDRTLLDDARDTLR